MSLQPPVAQLQLDIVQELNEPLVLSDSCYNKNNGGLDSTTLFNNLDQASASSKHSINSPSKQMEKTNGDFLNESQEYGLKVGFN